MISFQRHKSSLSATTHPEEHPEGDANVAESVPRHVSQSTVLDLGWRSVKLSHPDELQDLLGREESSYGEWLWGEGTWILIMDGLHVGRGGHSIDLTRKVDPETGQLGVLEATLGTHAKERGAMTLAVDSVTPILAKGAVGSSSSGKLLLVAGAGSSCSEDARLSFIGVRKDSQREQTRTISTLPVRGHTLRSRARAAGIEQPADRHRLE